MQEANFYDAATNAIRLHDKCHRTTRQLSYNHTTNVKVSI